MASDERILELVDLTYRAATDREAWGLVARAFSDLFGGAAITLVIQTPGLDSPAAAFFEGIDPELAHHAQLRSGESWSWVMAAGAELGTRFVRISEFFPDTDLAESELAKKFLLPQGLALELPIIHITSPEEAILSSGIGVYRREGGPPITEEQLGIADRLVPHLKRAIAIHAQLGNVEHRQIALHEVIDRIPTGVLILDTCCRPILVNRMAERILGSKDGLIFDEDGPRGIDRPTTKALRSLLDSAVNPAVGRELAAGGFLALPRESGLRPYPVLVTPILGRTSESTTTDAAVVLFVSDPEFRDISLTDVLMQVYGLTPAEAELAQLLAQGRSLEEAAKVRHVTLNTARSQLKQVFAKTDTNRQGELLQLVLSGVAVIDREADVGADVSDHTRR